MHRVVEESYGSTGLVGSPRTTTAKLFAVRMAPGILAAGLSLFLGFLNSGAKSLWLDEAWAHNIADGSWGEMWQEVTTAHAFQGSYYVLLHLWMGLFGNSEVALRSLSAIAGAGTVFGVYLVGRLAFGRLAGFAAALLLAVTAFFIRYQQEVRGYTILLFLLTLATYCLLRGVREGGVLVWIGYVACIVLAVYTHIFTIWVVLAHLAVLPATGVGFKRMLPVYGAVGLGVAPMAVWLLTSSRTSAEWIDEPTVSETLLQLTKLTFGRQPTTFVFAGLVLVAIGWGCAHVVRRKSSAWPVLLVLLWTVIPIAGTFVVSFFNPLFAARYLIVTFPGIALLLGWFLTQWSPPPIRVLALAVAVVAAIPAAVGWYTAPREDWREGTAFVLERAEPGDGVVAVWGHPWFYYADLLDDEGHAPEWVPVPSLRRIANVSHLNRIWLVRSNGAGPRGAFAKKRLEGWDLARHYYPLAGGIQVWLYEPKSG